MELLESLRGVHDVFHVSQLKKCLRVREEEILIEELTAKEDLTYEEYPVRILETTERFTRCLLMQKLICKHKGLIPNLNVKACQPI